MHLSGVLCMCVCTVYIWLYISVRLFYCEYARVYLVVSMEFEPYFGVYAVQCETKRAHALIFAETNPQITFELTNHRQPHFPNLNVS